jgi:hypothetical protein
MTPLGLFHNAFTHASPKIDRNRNRTWSTMLRPRRRAFRRGG